MADTQLLFRLRTITPCSLWTTGPHFPQKQFQSLRVYCQQPVISKSIFALRASIMLRPTQ